MVLAVDVLSAGWTALFYGLAVLFFVVGAISASVTSENAVTRIHPLLWIGFGLALAFFPSFWNALAAT